MCIVVVAAVVVLNLSLSSPRYPKLKALSKFEQVSWYGCLKFLPFSQEIDRGVLVIFLNL